MQESNFVQATESSSNVSAAQQETILHLRLLQVLQTSLDTDELLNNFFKHVQPIIDIAGITFSSNQGDFCLGRKTIHSRDYNLIINDEVLGKIEFSRRSRWLNRDLITIENILSYLVHPLRNALTHQRMAKLARIDGLTLIGNRAAFDEHIERAIQTAQRHSQPLTLVMLDIDHFKSINDAYGHLQGDKVLQKIANTINCACRSTDSVYRYGGEEFAILLGNTCRSGAEVFAKRLNQLIAGTNHAYQNQRFNLTASMGLTELRATDSSESFIDRADAALYRAKNAGRNRIEVAD